MTQKAWGTTAAIACTWALQTTAVAQPSVDPTPSRQTLEEATDKSCDGVSVIVRRCAARPADATPPDPKATIDPLTRSRAAAKAAFDRRDSGGQAAALDGTDAPASTPIGDAQRLGGVTVTGRQGEPPPSVEDVLQRALAPTPTSPNGTVSHYGADGVRYDCIAKCIGPACCATVRSMPNPARDAISIGR